MDDRLARPRMGQAPSAPQAAVMCPFYLHSPQPTRPELSVLLPVCEALSLSQLWGVFVSKSETTITLFAKYNKGRSLS